MSDNIQKELQICENNLSTNKNASEDAVSASK